MGKAADNECLKLEANFWNNISVGITLGVVIVPLASLYYNADWDLHVKKIHDAAFHPTGIPPDNRGFWIKLGTCTAIWIIGVIFAWALRQKADQTASRIQD